LRTSSLTNELRDGFWLELLENHRLELFQSQRGRSNRDGDFSAGAEISTFASHASQE
jgi:hypothetical protein